MEDSEKKSQNTPVTGKPKREDYDSMVEWLLDCYEWEKEHGDESGTYPAEPLKTEQNPSPLSKNEVFAAQKEEDATPKELKLIAKVRPEFSYVEYHADGLSRADKVAPLNPLSLIESLEVVNTLGQTVPGLAIVFSFDHEAFAIDDIVLPPCPSPAGPIRLPWLKVKKPLIDQTLERIPCELTIRLISTSDGSEISASKHHFNILPVSQTTDAFYKDRRLFAKYVTPLAPRVKQLANKAVVYNGGKAIVAYQNEDVATMMKELKATYEVLHDENLLYQNPPAGESFTQRVRLPEEALRDKKATCLDSTILYASLLEELGFHPTIVFIDGHAFVGVFLKEKDSLVGGYTDQMAEIASRIDKNSQTMVLIETTFICSGHVASFQDALDKGKSHLSLYEGKLFAAIDVHWCHTGKIYTPIPTEGNDFELENYIKQKEIEDRDLSPIIQRELVNVESEFQMDRFKTWERKLLDLSEANRLVRFKADPRSSVRLVGKDVPGSLLLGDAVNLSLVGITQAAVEASYMTSDHASFAPYYEGFDGATLLAFGNESTLKALMKKAKSALEETGASPLYLSLGLLTFPSPKTGTKIHAPFLLLPVSLKKEGVGKRYSMSYDLGDLKINETVFEYIKLSNPDLNFNTIYSFDDLSKYPDLIATFRRLAGGEIVVEEDYFFLSNLSFAHQVMWLDMVKRKDELSKNVVIKSIVDNQSHLTDEVISEEESVEELEKYEDFAAPLYYDSSQLKAILDCGQGKSFILDGPPGTGKSQTIVNMIANAFYNGKKVLFVAEKKAALDVVADRLAKLGLGNYCLELHSNKATKGDFFSKLGAVMDFGQTKNPEDYRAQCESLTAKKNELRQAINKMHSTERCCLSLYDCILATRQLAYLYDKRIPLRQDFVEEYGEEKSLRVNQLLESYISLAKGIHGFERSPLKAFGLTQLNFFTDREIVASDLDEANKATLKYLAAIGTFEKALPFELPQGEAGLKAIFSLMEAIYSGKLFADDIAELYGSYIEIDNLLREMKSLAATRAKINETLDIDGFLENINLEEAATILRNAQGLLKKIKAQKHLKAMFQPFSKIPLAPETLGNLILQASQFKKKKEDLQGKGSKFRQITGLDPYACLDQLSEIEERISFTKDFFVKVMDLAKNGNGKVVATYFLSLAKSKDPFTKMQYETLLEAKEEFAKTDKSLSDKYVIDERALRAKGDYYQNLLKLLRFGADPKNFNDLVSMAGLNKIAEGLRQEGLGGLVEAVVDGSVLSEEMPELLKISLAYGCLSIYFGDEDINSFSPTLFDAEIKHYKDAIRLYSETTVQCISAKISQSFARSDIAYGSSGAIGRLKKSIANNGRGVSIRGTLSEFGDVILKYFPCFLMSPLSAAQYLAVDDSKGKAFSKFDIVIFDEASQIPTHEAIGPIARGKSLIVAGDPKQMPPSPYFSAGLSLYDDDEEDEDITKFTDSPSLLDECISIDMPRHRLSYHYRSKHESLIQFSNANFYGNGLYTFPSSSTATSCVEFHYIQPKTAKKDSSLSKEELSVILDVFKGIYKDPKNANKSLGIICFNIKQADLISDAINDMLGADKALAAVVEKAGQLTGEPWFVKSIENVQGDERDIILLSVGFALSKTGYPMIRGPLVAGDNNGERRLNVAASRSKERMIVVSTIKASQFPDDLSIKNPGAKCLKHFLKYAEDSSFRVDNESGVDESSILYYIKADLEERGFQVDAYVGNSDFRVDLALRNESSDHYELGILVDTGPIEGEISSRDKFYVQEAILNSMKWKILRVYALEYFKSPEETIRRIVEAFHAEYASVDTSLDIHIEKAEAEEGDVYGAKEFELPSLYPISYSNERGYDSSLRPSIQAIIEALSPVSYGTIKKIIGDLCGFKSFTGERESRLESMLKQRFYQNREYDGTQYFYWANERRDMLEFRKAGGRDVNDISIVEIACAMGKIQEVQGGLSKEHLYKALMGAFDFPTKAVTAHYRERFEAAFELAKEKGIL